MAVGKRVGVTDARGRKPVTAAEAAVFLGITSSAVRHIVRRDAILAAGVNGRAKTYWMHDIVDAVGAHDRRVLRKRRRLCHT